jgi:hypothetical protein
VARLAFENAHTLRLTDDEFAAQLQAMVPAREPAPAPAPVESPYLSTAEAAAYCRVAKKTLYNHRKYIERVPGVGKLLFTRAALDKWLATRRKKGR